MTSAGTLALKVGDSNGIPVSDQVVVQGSTMLAGTLTVAPVAGEPVQAGDSYQLLSDPSNPLVGVFDEWNPQVPGHTWNSPAYGSNAVTVTAAT